MFPEAKYQKIKNWIEGKSTKPELDDTFQDKLILNLIDQCKTHNLPPTIPSTKETLSFKQIDRLLADVLSGSAEDDDAEILLSGISYSRETFDKISIKLDLLEKGLEPEAEKLLPGLLKNDSEVLAFLNENFSRHPQKTNSFSFSELFNSFLKLFVLKPMPAYVGTFAIVLLVVAVLGLTGGINDPVYKFYFNSEGAYYSDTATFRGTTGVESTEDTAEEAMFKAAMGEYLTGNYEKSWAFLDVLGKEVEDKNSELNVKIELYKGLSCLGMAKDKKRWGYKSYLKDGLNYLDIAEKNAETIQSNEINRIRFFMGLTSYLLDDFEKAKINLNQITDDTEFSEKANKLLKQIASR